MYRRRKTSFKRNMALMAGLVNWKVKMVMDLYPDAAGEVRLGINYNGLPNSTVANDTMVLANDVTGALVGHTFNDTLNALNILDQFRCAGVSVKFLPGFPAGTAAITTGYSPLTIMYDRDGLETTLATTTFNDLTQQVHRTKTKNLYRPWKTFHKSIKYGLYNKIPIGPGGFSPNTNLWGMWHGVADALGQTSNVYGCHCTIVSRPLDSTVFPVGQSLGTLVLTGYFQYKDRR